MLDLIAACLALTALLSQLNHRVLRLPPLIGIMAASMGLCVLTLGLDAMGWHQPLQDSRAFVQGIDFSAVLMQGLLCMLLFAGALSVDVLELRKRRWPVAVLATLGTILSTLLLGAVSWWGMRLVGRPVSWHACLLWGAIVSPTDPIAVLGIVRGAGIPASLEVVIVGESLFNDGVAIVLFLLLGGAHGADNASDMGQIAREAMMQALGGLAAGALLGGLLAEALRSRVAQAHALSETVLLSVAAVIAGYALSTHLGVSGPLAMVVAGLLVRARLDAPRLTANKEGQGQPKAPMDAMDTMDASHAIDARHARDSTDPAPVPTVSARQVPIELTEAARSGKRDTESLLAFWQTCDEILNAVLFVLLGLQCLVLPWPAGQWRTVVAAIAAAVLARAMAVWLCTAGVRRRLGLERGAVWLLSWGGLRGGLSVAMALSLPHSPTRDALMDLSYGVVVFSILVQGLSLGPLARRLGLPTSPPLP